MKKLKILFILLIIVVFSGNKLFAQRYSTWFTAKDTSVILQRALPYYTLVYLADSNAFYYADTILTSGKTIGHCFTQGWLNKSVDRNNIWNTNNGHIYPIKDTVTIGNIHNPSNIFEVKDLIKFNNTNRTSNFGYNSGENGINNTFVGYQSGKAVTGNDNTFIGENSASGSSSLTGSHNIGLGIWNALSMTTGSNNIMIGDYAGQSITTGYINTLIGSYAGYHITTGDYNSLIGYEAGKSITDQSKCLAIGWEALSELKTDTPTPNIVAIGTGSLRYADSIRYATFVGSAAGGLIDSIGGSYCTGIGYASLYQDEGFGNTAVGHESGYLTTTGADNTYLGKYAGRYNKTGDYNVIVGSEALWQDTIGEDRSVIIGFGAKSAGQAGYNNVLLGYKTSASQSKSNNTTHDNTILGYQAGFGNAANENVFIGSNSGYGNTTGYENVYIGKESGYSSGSSRYNVIVGFQAGQDLNSGFSDVLIGRKAGANLTSGYGNVMIGDLSGSSLSQTGGVYNIFIGFNAGYLETGSNKLYIENSSSSTPLIYGEFDNDFIKINGGLRAKITNVNASTYTVLTSDYIINVTYSATGTTTITLPTPANGMRYIIKDAGGNATTNTITINTTSGTIDGASSYLLNTNYDAINVYSDGTNWFVY